MTILAISPFLWTMSRGSGVPTLFKTLEGLASRAETHLLMPATEAGTEVRSGIHIHTFRLPGWDRFGTFGPDRSVFSHTLPGGRLGRFLLDKLLWFHFVVLASAYAIRLNQRVRADVYYGVTPYGAPIALLLRLLFGGINVTRLLGTFLAPVTKFGSCWTGRLRAWLWLMPHFTEVVAFLWPAGSIIVTDDGTRGAEVGRALGLPDVHCWRNGVDVPSSAEIVERPALEQSLRQRFAIAEGPIALYTGQLVAWKRVDRMLRSIAIAREQEGLKLTVILVGDGPERAPLVALCSELNLGDSVRFAGSVPQQDLGAFYLGANFFVCAHDLTCACNSTFEAMAAGLAIVATDVGETSSVITHEADGLLVNPDDEAALASSIHRVASDEQLRNRLGTAARSRILRDFGTWSDRAFREYSLLQKVALESQASTEKLRAC